MKFQIYAMTEIGKAAITELSKYKIPLFLSFSTSKKIVRDDPCTLEVIWHGVQECIAQRLPEIKKKELVVDSFRSYFESHKAEVGVDYEVRLC